MWRRRVSPHGPPDARKMLGWGAQPASKSGGPEPDLSDLTGGALFLPVRAATLAGLRAISQALVEYRNTST